MNYMWGMRERRAKAGCRNFGLSNCEDGGFALDVERGQFVGWAWVPPQSLEELTDKQLYMTTLKLA